LTPGIFDELDRHFEGRLREHRIVTKTFKGERGEISVTSATAVFEAKFNFKVLDRLHNPCFLAVERETAERPTYLIYEALAPSATHFQMLGMNVAMPTIVRREFLETISGGWGKSEETWIDVIAVPTRYQMDMVDNEPVYTRSRLTPLTGARAHILSKDSVERFLCVKPGTELGNLLGFDLPLTIEIADLVRFHAGIFGFTGVGKSNLTSYLIRQSLENDPSLKAVIFDVAGEYAIHLLDLLMTDGEIFSSEECDSADKFLSSQVIPETLEEKLGGSKILERHANSIIDGGRCRPISLVRASEIPLEYVITKLQEAAESDRAGATQAKFAVQKLETLLANSRLNPKIGLTKIPPDAKEALRMILSDLQKKLSERTALRADAATLVEYLEATHPAEEADLLNPQRLAKYVLSERAPKLSIVYLPEPDDARLAVSSFLRTLLMLKKVSGPTRKSRLLIVLDEAQEFIPDRTRSEDFTDASNRAVEALLRHGRKYRAHCWLSTQRVAHLNVNALHQLHSYFVSVLPRSYDRWVIAEAFSLNTALLDKTIDLETGEWLFVSYKATKQKNIPTFIKAPNNEEIVASKLLG